MERRKKEKRKTRIREGNKQGRVCMQNKRLQKFPILFNIFNNMIFCESFQFEMRKVILI